MVKEKHENYIFICTGKDCKKNNAKKLLKDIKANLPKTKIIKTKCVDYCKKGPVVYYKDQKILRANLEIVRNRIDSE